MTIRYTTLATDGDGTLLRHGKLAAQTASALIRARQAGVTLILVTGETGSELTKFPRLDLFDYVVAENGAILIDPRRCEETVLGSRPPRVLIESLHDAGMNNLTVGRSMISIPSRYKRKLHALVDEIGLDWEVIRNRHDIMLLPQGVSKARGLSAALEELDIERKHVVAIGDAENDIAMLEFAGVGVAVSDAVPKLKKRADLVTRSHCGAAISELVDMILRDELPTFRGEKFFQKADDGFSKD